MMAFDSPEKLIDYLKLDHDKAALSPVRFINVENLNDWAVMKKALFDMTQEHILLSEFCDDDDLMPNLT